MKIPGDFIKSVLHLVRARLGTLGFKKRKHGILTIKMSDEVIGWLGLNRASRGGILELNAVVGVRNQRLEKLVADLVGGRFDEITPPTLAGNIGYMMPEDKYCPYFFSQDRPVETVVEELVESIREHGLPFIRSHLEMSDLVEGMHTCRFSIPIITDYRIPVGLFLLGDTDGAEMFLKTKLGEQADRRDPAALQYRIFATKLSELWGTRTE